tara:strand:- start:774 stop:1583 length:810 start_codon:yes stop_codon:yes gene_type:complete
MAIYTLTPAQLKGAGIYNSFEIPAGGIATTSSFRLLTVGQTNNVGPNATYTDWLITTGSDGITGGAVNGPYSQSSNGMTNWSFSRVAQSGRGSTIYGLGRGYGQLRLNDIPAAGTSGSQVIPGTITDVDLTFRIGVLSSSTTAGAGDRLGIFSAGTGSISGVLTDFPLYIITGSKTAYSDFVTISSSISPNPKEITFSLNSTAIAVMNDQNKNDGELINFAFIWEKDFTGTAPTDEMRIYLASGSNANEEEGTPADYFIPKFDITYIPD